MRAGGAGSGECGGGQRGAGDGNVMMATESHHLTSYEIDEERCVAATDRSIVIVAPHRRRGQHPLPSRRLSSLFPSTSIHLL